MRPSRWLFAVALALPLFASAQPLHPLTGTLHEVHVGPGQQSDPHVSGTFVAYTHGDGATSEIRFHDLATGANAAIPNFGANDLLSDIWDQQIVFTRTTPERSALFRYDISSGAPAVEVAPTPDANRRAAAIGGGTIAWMDHGLLMGVPEIVVLEAGAVTPVRLTQDLAVDRDPAVSPDGRVVVWVRCESAGACELMEAVRGPGGWATQSLGTVEADARPDTDGTHIVYTAERQQADADLYWQPVGGGEERRLVLEGSQHNANVSRGVVAFEHAAPETPANADILIFDLTTGILYQLTDTPERESLSDLYVAEDGAIRVVWSAPGVDGLDVLAMTLTELSEAPIPEEPEDPPTGPEETSCENPGARPLLLELTIEKERCNRRVHTTFEASAGGGLLCIENGKPGKKSKRASAGWVDLNGEEVVGPHDFGKKVSHIERDVTLLEGENLFEGKVRSHPHSRIHVRIYGPDAGGGGSGAPGEDDAIGKGRWKRVFHGRPGWVERVSEHAMGCSSSGNTQAGAAMMLIILALLITNGPTRRDRVRVRVRSGRGRRR
ncbi:MAG TPA: hypothetical protein VK013_11320 [Myxococcaceae bacterium]|nr:hypothetical protein [Myxococcaceae bacterium]